MSDLVLVCLVLLAAICNTVTIAVEWSERRRRQK